MRCWCKSFYGICWQYKIWTITSAIAFNSIVAAVELAWHDILFDKFPLWVKKNKPTNNNIASEMQSITLAAFWCFFYGCCSCTLATSGHIFPRTVLWDLTCSLVFLTNTHKLLLFGAAWWPADLCDTRVTRRLKQCHSVNVLESLCVQVKSIILTTVWIRQG